MSQLFTDKNFEDIFESTTDMIHYLLPDGRIELVNPSWLNTLGYSRENVKGKNIYDIIHPDFLDTYKKTRLKAIQSGTHEVVETVLLTKTGKLVFGKGDILCVYKEGNPLYTRCVFKNITERRLIEKQLIENEKRLKTFLERAPDAVIVIDEQQKIIQWNPKAEFIFGFSAQEVIGKHLAETIIPPQYKEAHKKGFAHFLATGVGPVLNKTIEITAMHKKGHEFFINLSISNVKLEDRWVFIAFISDISEKKKTEQELIHKEAELLQSKLLQEKQDEFISIASHELKTPLTTIKAFTQLAIASANIDNYTNVKSYLSKVEQQISRLGYLMNHLLDVSKIHAGKLILSKESIDISAFLPTALNMIELISPTHKVILEKNESANVLIDVMRMEQVINNIVVNAMKYSPGKETIIINSIVNKDEVTVSVRDFGIGIPSDKIEQIFTRYYRVEDKSGRFSGLGIGLFISAEIIKEHGGMIWAESKENEGSTFFFSLPLAIEPPALT